MVRDDCIFCKIANGVIPAAALYEDDDFKVILDAGPASKGHALILPKQHYQDLCGEAGKSHEKRPGMRWVQSGAEQWGSRWADGKTFSYAYHSPI